MSLPLDNIVWHALNGPHRALAQFAGAVGWYPPDVAPFIAVRGVDCVPDLEAAAALGFCGPAYFIGVVPDSLPQGWRFESRVAIAQMLPASGEPPPVDETDMRLLGVADRPGMLALTRTAFPDYFRERTPGLGDYLGIHCGTQLVAMAGERLALDGWREISGVCTHPEFRGRGYAGRLTQAFMHRHRRCGVKSLLHVSESNLAAKRLYESMGFAARANLAQVKVERSRLPDAIPPSAEAS
jgi:GNAT superfamily N-acetyltransferase